MPIYYIIVASIIDNDHSDKKVNKHICQGYSVPLLCLYTQCYFQQNFFKNFLLKSSQPVYTPVEKVLRYNGQKQEKKKAFKINAKIEYVGLNED